MSDDDDEARSAATDRSLDKITDEAMEQVDADMEQAQAAQNREKENVAAIVSKHFNIF